MGKSYELIRDYVDSLHIIDTHEHLPPNCSYLSNPLYRDPGWDILSEYLQHYMSSDLCSAGLPLEDLEKARDFSQPLMDRWRLIEPYWEAARYTGYARVLDIAVRDIYSLPGINQNTIEEADIKFRAAFGKDQYEKVLKEKSKILVCLSDRDIWDKYIPDADRACDPRFFRSVFQLEEFYYPKMQDDILLVQAVSGIKMHRFEDWLEACEASIEKAVCEGSVALKIPMAYTRSLQVGRSSFYEAEEIWNSFYEKRRLPDFSAKPLHVPKAFQDYVIHFILSRIAKRGLPVQIHTGLLEGSGNHLPGSNPGLLNNLFLEYPDIRFDIFHMGYPYQQELIALAKMFPNVYIDMCWAHIISPTASQNALVEMIDAVPVNKISAFGGDYIFADGVYGHQVIARDNVSISLDTMVQAGVFDVDEAKEIARKLFVENPAKLFDLEGLIVD